MDGQYILNELLEMPGTIISGVKDFVKGRIIIVNNRTVNYYRRENDDTWTNYDCKTINRMIF